MITTDEIEIGGALHKRTKSDTYKIRKVGTDEIYSAAIDLLESNYVYEETDIPLLEKPASEPSKVVGMFPNIINRTGY